MTNGNRMPEPRVLVIGAGIGGLTAAKTLAHFGVPIDLVERCAALGGHAARFACKATDRCVKCGACLVTEAIAAATSDPRIRIHAGSRLGQFRRKPPRFEFTIEPSEVAIPGGSRTPPAGGHAAPPVAAFADAVVLAAGFDAFDPKDKAYGHGFFPNVITLLESEHELRRQGALNRPSDGCAPQHIAFIQCVGSRDAKLGHLWCSQFCCAAALRTARRIKTLRPQTEITVFYIDIQSVGRDFEDFYRQCRQELRFIRAIPSEASAVDGGGIRLIYTEGSQHPLTEAVFDLVVLSTGMVPPTGLNELAARLGWTSADTGFAPRDPGAGIFAAGAVRGPMRIAESMADARDAAARVLAFLGRSWSLAERLPLPPRLPCGHLIYPQGACRAERPFFKV
jgi:heterodisulfide reductase subunit A